MTKFRYVRRSAQLCSLRALCIVITDNSDTQLLIAWTMQNLKIIDTRSSTCARPPRNRGIPPPLPLSNDDHGIVCVNCLKLRMPADNFYCISDAELKVLIYRVSFLFTSLLIIVTLMISTALQLPTNYRTVFESKQSKIFQPPYLLSQRKEHSCLFSFKVPTFVVYILVHH